jgi:aminoglycoside phosphotransferase family enzyme/predicted kinase
MLGDGRARGRGGPGASGVSSPTGVPELVSALLEPAFYPHAPAAVELRETHISWVFLAGDLAYKVKKPLVLPFLDYGTLERRHRMCREEVRLNRRLAPAIYLRVVGISRAGGGYSLTSEDDPGAIEYAVEMRRADEARSMAALALAGNLEGEHVVATAAVLACFHGAAPAAPPEPGDISVLERTLDENATTLREMGDGIVDPTRLHAAEHFTRSFLAAGRDRLAGRARSGLIRDCHGDLRAEHVIVPEQGEIYVYDCVEFNPELRQIDVAADFAFLVMDLTRLGQGSLALRMVEAYRGAGGDPGDDALVSFFASYRAWVRAKVACVRARELPSEDPDRERAASDARELIALGHRFAWRARRPLVLVLCGVSGSGKTTLARELRELSGWEHVSSDLIRKRLAGLAPTERGGEDLYSRERTIETYRELGKIAAERLRSDAGVIVDATFHLREEREAFLAGLGPNSAPLLFVECRASDETLRDRVRRRALDADRVSDADTAVLRRQLAARKPLEEIPRSRRAEFVTEAEPTLLASELEALLDARLFR